MGLSRSLSAPDVDAGTSVLTSNSRASESMSLQSPALTASHDHSPIFRGVSALITFFHQLNIRPDSRRYFSRRRRQSSRCFGWWVCTGPPENMKRPTAGFGATVSTLVLYGITGLRLERMGLPVREELSVGLSCVGYGRFSCQLPRTPQPSWLTSSIYEAEFSGRCLAGRHGLRWPLAGLRGGPPPRLA